VLLIVCVNLGNLMLVRANERVRESAIRRALGAGAGQLFRPILAESLLISLAGGALGVLVAAGGLRALVMAAPVDIPRLDEVHISLTTLLFAMAVSAGSGIVCGLWPAIRAMGAQPADALRSGSRSATEGRSRLRSREWLVGLEVALSTVLLVMAALLGVSFLRVTNVARGYYVDHVLTADVTLPGTRYRTNEQRAMFHQRALEKIESLPGIRAAGLTNAVPLKARWWGDAINKEGETLPRAERPLAHYGYISPHFLDAMGVAVRQGRPVTEADRSHKVAMVSESAARAVWPGESAVGKRINNDPRKDWVEVIGVVADVRADGLEKQPPIAVYVPYWDGVYWQGEVRGNQTYVIRTSQDPAAMAGALRAVIHEMDAELPLANVLTMEAVMSESVAGRRFQTMLAGCFAGAALLLASLGIYGTISYTVARRRNEVGIRVALGAQPLQVSRLVLGQGMRPVAGGLVTGVAASLGAGRWIGSFLFGTAARDPVSIGAVVAVLLVVAVAACWGPARRAARIDPMVALRGD